MSRCACCNIILSDYELSLRSSNTGQFLDMCTTCIKEAEIVPVSFSQSIEATSVEGEEHEF